MFCMVVNRGIFLILFVFHVCLTQRRIKNGQPQTEDKRYMVYFIRASASAQKYDAWLCGGSLVTSRSIITSAACIEDVEFMYAIAGYKKYVQLDKLNNNECTKVAKKKVVETCVPKRYDFAYEKIERWSFIDIGIAKVESAFDLTKTVGKCSYAPAKLKVNFDEKWQIPGLDAFVLGWGHATKWREREDTKDYNQKELHYTTTVIINKEQCKKEYSTTPVLFDIIDRYMICADGPGNINPQGEIIEEVPRLAEGCDPSRRYGRPESCEDEYGRSITYAHKAYSGRSGPNRPIYEQMYGQPSLGINGQPYGQPNPNYGQPSWQPNSATYGQPYGLPNPATYGQPYGLQNPATYSHPKQTISETYDKPYPSKSKSRRIAIPKNSKDMDRDLKSTKEAINDNKTFLRSSVNNTRIFVTNATRRNGICQNDHGGPLVTWVGTKEYLIGVASVFRIDENLDCTGPYLYTSTQCNAAFLHCILSADKDWTENKTEAQKGVNNKTRLHSYFKGYSRRKFCDLPPQERGFDMQRRRISWSNHPGGPADNELTERDLENMELRPQIPLSAFAGR